jgi:hypothetical protein
VTVHGSYFSRLEIRENFDKLGVSAGRFQEGDRSVYRFRTSFTTGPMDIGDDKAVILHFAPQASGFYPATGDWQNTIGESNVGVVEGFLRLATSSYDLDVGRFIMNYGHSAIIGSLDWHQTARSFQGSRLRLHLPENAYADVFMTQLSEGAPGQTDFLAGDSYFGGVYAGLGSLLGGSVKALDVYALANIWNATPATAMTMRVPPAVQGTIGALYQGGVGNVDYMVEGGIQLGKRRVGTANPDIFAYNSEAEVGYKLGGLRVAGYGAYVSGEDGEGDLNSWDQLYPTAHAFFGLMDVIGPRSNIADGALRVSYVFGNGLIFKGDLHNFIRPEAYGPNGETGYAGSEANLHFIYKIGKGLVIRALYGAFLPNEDMYNTSDAAHYGELELRYDI